MRTTPKDTAELFRYSEIQKRIGSGARHLFPFAGSTASWFRSVLFYDEERSGGAHGNVCKGLGMKASYRDLGSHSQTSERIASASTRYQTRWATVDDLPALKKLMLLAIDTLQVGLLSRRQIAASHAIMGLDTQLIKDGTYLVAEKDGVIVGCGGWSNRATLYGGDHSTDLRNSGLLDPARDLARIRAMYTNPAFARQGIGRLVLLKCEQAASENGFTAVELMATLSGEQLYAVSGYERVEELQIFANGVAIPLVRMRKQL